jgi:hypothetical protein
MSVLDGWTPANRAALAVAAASALLCLSAWSGARRLAPLPEEGAAVPAEAMPQVAARTPDASDAQILRAVARDPFRPDRRRPPGRYRMPGEAAPPEPQPVFDYGEAAPILPAFTLLGTVDLGGGRGMAALGGAGGDSRIVRVGEEIEGFRVLRVGNGTATLSNGDTTLVLKTTGAP